MKVTFNNYVNYIAGLKKDIEGVTHSHQDLSQFVPHPDTESKTNHPRDVAVQLQDDLDELKSTAMQTAHSIFKHFGFENDFPLSLDKKKNKNNLAINRAKAVLAEQGQIEKEILQLQEELNAHASESYYQTVAPKLLKEKIAAYLDLQNTWYKLVMEQLSLLDTKEPTVHTTLEEINAKMLRLKQDIDSLKSSMDADNPSVITGLVKDLQSGLKELVTPYVIQDDQAGNAAIAKLKEGNQPLSAEELLAIQLHLEHSQEAKTRVTTNKNAIEKVLKDYILQQIYSHPWLAKIVVDIIAVTAGTLLAGPIAGFAAKTAVDRIMQEMLPNASPETQAGKIACGIVEALGTFMAGGATAAVVSGGATAFKEIAPAPLQDAATAASMAYVANKAGFSLTTSLGFGLGSALALKNLKLFGALRKDLQHAWKICREQPLKIAPEFGRFVVTQIRNYADATVKAIKEGHKTEAITRIATGLISAVGITMSLGALPLSLALFYLVNKSYEIKFNGPATLHNPEFRNFVLNEYNADNTKNIETLRNLLIRENPSQKDLYESLK